jgi:hypothetical protein
MMMTMMMIQVTQILMETVTYQIGKNLHMNFFVLKISFSVQTTCFRDREIHNRLEKHR